MAKKKSRKAEKGETFWIDGSAEVEGIELEGNNRIMKVNVPDNACSWRSGNGEGMWGYIRREEDLPKYDAGEGEFEVILLNTSVCWPQLPWGTIITAEGRGENRPVICKRQYQRLAAERKEYFEKNPEKRPSWA